MAVAQAKKAATQPRVSFKLENMTSGGLVPEGDYQIKDASFVLWDYDGRLASMTLAFRLTLNDYNVQTGVVGGDDFVQHYSAGDAEKFVPDETGKGLLAVAAATQVSKSSNFALWLENIISAGFPEDAYDDDVSVFEGYIGHLAQISQPKRNITKSNIVGTAQTDQNKDRTIPVFISTIALPGQQPAKRAGAVARPAAAKAAAVTPPSRVNGKIAPSKVIDVKAVAEAVDATDDPNAATLAEVLGTVVKESMTTTQVRPKVFQALAKVVDGDTRQAIMNYFKDGDQLAVVAEMAQLTFDGETLAPAG